MSSTQLPAGHILYTVPDGWVKEQPTSAMRMAQYRWPGVQGAADADMAVFFFPGTGGSVEANLSRWYRQFKQPDGKPTQDVADTKKMTVSGIPITITYATGTYLQPQNPMSMGGPVDEMKDYALLAAIAETEGGPWFFKAVGPQKTIDHWRDSFTKFVESFKLAGSPA